jgi:uncharacterized coiled-coil protein SlyX
MTDTPIEARVAKLESEFIEIKGSLDRIEQSVTDTRQRISEIRNQIARSVAPGLNAAPDGTVAIRNPDVIAQQFRMRVRGRAPSVLPGPWPPPWASSKSEP